MFLNYAILVLVHGHESHLKLGLVKVIRRGAISEHSLQESLGLGTIKGSTVINVKLTPYLLDNLVIDLLSGNICSQSSAECAVVTEDLVIDKHLNASGETLPDYAVSVLKCLSINNYYLWLLFNRLLWFAFRSKF